MAAIRTTRRPRQRTGTDDLTGWASQVMQAQDMKPARHHLELLRNLTDVAEGRCDRLMVLMPPGSAKSTYASQIFPAWWLQRFEHTNIIAAAHTADLASHFGRRVRNMLAEHGGETALARDNRSAHRFATEAGGEYFATGVQGPLTGRRADLALIDDPIKSHAVADSATARQAIWDWYRSELLTRLKPNGRIVLVMTRWHEDDLGGRLLETQDGWRTLKLPAIATENDPLHRQPGEALWPEWQDLAALHRQRQSVGSRIWSAMYQQAPTPPTGTLFPINRIIVADTLPTNLSCCRAWDLAATEAGDGRDPDWTVGLKLGRDSDGKVYVLDIIRLRGGPNEVTQTIVATAQRDGRSVPIGLPQDPGQAGKQQIAWLTGLLAGYRVQASPESGSKLTRATPAAATAEAGNLILVRANWTDTLLDELRDFPHGNKDDQVDALSRAFSMLTTPNTRRLNLGFLAR